MSSIPQLTLFPLYPGGPQVRNTGSLNASSSFYLPATKFTPAYGVNVSSSNNNDKNYAVGPNRTITNYSVSQADSFNRSIAFDGSVLGGLKQTPVSAVAPAIPDLYKQAVDLLSVSDLKFSELMAQPSFRLPGIGMGLKVTTDGMGGVDSISLSPSSRGALRGPSAISPDFGINRAEITIGATPKIDLDGGLGTVATKKVFSPTNNNANTAITNNLINNLTTLNQPNSLAQNAGLFNLNPVGGTQAQGLNSTQLASNPVLDRLNQLQPRDNGLAVAGADATISAEQARQIAASQAKLEVETSERFKSNIANLASASKQTENYAATFRAPNLEGKLPITPYIRHTEQAFGNGLGAQSGFAMGSAVADAMDRKSSGGYIPFQMQAGTQGNFGGGQSNPFLMTGGFGNPSGATGDQQRHGQPYKRQPLAFTA